jgi:translation initiation factor IF-2
LAITRVYILAKELGVKSTAIVEKCQAEGLDVKNHMTTISAGLAATIREWFSEGDNVTTVEQSQKVDLEKVRVPRKAGRPEAEEPTAPEIPVEIKEPEETTPVEIPVEPVVPVAEEPQQQLEPVSQVEEEHAVVTQQPVKESEPVIPAGPMLDKPAPAKLTGPQVIRMEAPEHDRPRRPKPRPRYDTPLTQPLMVDKEESSSGAKGLKPGAKKHKDRTHGRRHEGAGVAEPGKKIRPVKWRQTDIEERRARLDAAAGETLRLRPTRKIASKADREVAVASKPQKVTVTEPITVRSLAAALAVKNAEVISKLMQQGIMSTANQGIAPDVAELIAIEFGAELSIEHRISLEEQIKAEFEQRARANLQKRPVIATMLGHVDHGKTSLLDKIRSAHVAAGEFGGITQHISAYQVAWGEKKVTFLDTPGHEAFTALRARGATMTDVVVLVVAADDGVMPQTIEAIAHSKAANVPIIIALNKVDLPGIDFNRIYAQFSEHGLTPVEWGGQTEVVKTSAITGLGINDLLDHIDYVADLLDLKADDTIPATGWVVEAKMSAQQGPVATFLIKEGKLSKGDIILAGETFGKVKLIKNSFGKVIKTATSTMPVEVTGLNNIPQAGDKFYCLDNLNKAKTAAEENQNIRRETSLAERTLVTLDNLFSQIEAGKVKELNIILRADVQGSVDVLKKYISELSGEQVKLKILHASTGGITEGDVVLAEASNAIVIGFNVVAEERVAKIAESKGVEIRYYNIIYRITEDLTKSMTGLLEPEISEKYIGRAVIRTTFKVSRIGTIAGCYVSDGVVTKNAKVRLIRDNIVVRNDLTLESLKHFKDDAREVRAGLECGIKIANFDDIKTDDVLDFYEMVKVAGTLR